MTLLLLMCALGLPAGYLLLMRVPLCSKTGPIPDGSTSIVIPARNEEHNLPRLLQSIAEFETDNNQVIVVDDGSQDRTAELAQECGARVIPSPSLPASWTGKTWACHCGAEIVGGDTLVFIDADTWFSPGGLQRVLRCYWAQRNKMVALSVLPFHITREPYEELSLFFNLMMAAGAGGFGPLGGARLFGQSLYVSRALYNAIGGHASVRDQVLENVSMAELVQKAGGRCVCLGGREVQNVRMFPEGFRQLCEGWTKAFAAGAAASEPLVLILSIFWLTAQIGTFLVLLFAAGPWRVSGAILYTCFVLQTWWLARQIGTYRFSTCVMYPIPMAFFFALFTRSLLRRILKQQVTWRGRQL